MADTTETLADLWELPITPAAVRDALERAHVIAREYTSNSAARRATESIANAVRLMLDAQRERAAETGGADLAELLWLITPAEVMAVAERAAEGFQRPDVMLGQLSLALLRAAQAEDDAIDAAEARWTRRERLDSYPH